MGLYCWSKHCYAKGFFVLNLYESYSIAARGRLLRYLGPMCTRHDVLGKVRDLHNKPVTVSFISSKNIENRS